MSARTSKMEWYPEMPGAEYVKVFVDGKEIKHCFFCRGADAPGIEVRGKVAYYVINNLEYFREPITRSKSGMVRWEWTNEEIPWEIWKNSI